MTKSVNVPPVSMPTALTVLYRIGVLDLAGMLVAAFFLGAIPFAYLLVKAVKGIDVRQIGSGNPGATNAARAFPKRVRIPAFLVIFGLDAGKGYLATGVVPGLFLVDARGPALAALAAVLGHSFSPFLRFRGGKGVATTIGALFGLEPVATALALAVFFLVFGLTRTVSLGSLAFATALPVAVIWRGETTPAVTLLSIGLSLLIVIRHRTNIVKLIQGVEP